MDGILGIGIFLVIILILALGFKIFFKNYLPEILSVVGALGLTLTDIQSNSKSAFIGEYTWEDAWPLLFIFSLLLLFVGIIISAFRQRKFKGLNDLNSKVKTLEKKIERIKKDYYRLCSDKIKWAFDGFFQDGEARVSIYQHQGDHFTLLGRYSNITSYNNNSNSEYKDSEGFIALGWNQNEFEDQQAPPWKGAGKPYKAYMKLKCNITDARIQKIRMKSCSFFIKTLHDDTTSDDPDGIIVFEKVRPNSIDTACVKSELSFKNVEMLSFLKNMKSLTKKLEG